MVNKDLGVVESAVGRSYGCAVYERIVSQDCCSLLFPTAVRVEMLSDT